MNKYNTVFQTGLFFAFAAILFSFLLAFILTPLARKLAFRFHCLDIPDGKRNASFLASGVKMNASKNENNIAANAKNNPV